MRLRTCTIYPAVGRFQLLSMVAAFLLILAAFEASASAQTKRRTATGAIRSITIRTEPNAIVWIDEVRRGVTDLDGRLAIKSVSPGGHVLRVRAEGFREATIRLTPARRGDVAVRLARTTDQAELLFQQAEAMREKAKDEQARRAAVELYRRSLALRPRFAAAQVGLARVLLELNDYNGALEAVDAAHDIRPVYPEASAVEGRILRMSADENAAVEAFQRAITDAKGFQPEAHTGLALIYEDKGRYDDAASSFSKAIAQLSDTEPVLYQLLGAVYEKLEKYQEAVAAYEKYLELAPNGSLAPAIRSMMDQLRKQAEGRGGLPF